MRSSWIEDQKSPEREMKTILELSDVRVAQSLGLCCILSTIVCLVLFLTAIVFDCNDFWLLFWYIFKQNSEVSELHFFILFCVEFQTYYIQDSKNLHVDLFFVCVEPMFTNGVSAVVTLYEIWSFMHDIIDYCFYEIK